MDNESDCMLHGGIESYQKTDEENGKIPSKTEIDNDGERTFDALELQESRLQKETKKKELIYKVSDNPPIHLMLFFGLQQALIPLCTAVAFSLVVAETVCAGNDEEFKTRLLSSTLFMNGVTSLLQTLLGLRLPIFQGASPDYIPPLLALQQLDKDRCNVQVETFNNGSMNFTRVLESREDIILRHVQELQGSLIAAGCIHFLIGATGLIGVLLRFIGPVTIVPTILLIGIYVTSSVIQFSEVQWGVSLMTAGITMILSQYLTNKEMPIPVWTRKKNCHVTRYPLHQVLSILIAMGVGWIACWIMTETGAFEHATNSTVKEFYARTDARNYVIARSKWFNFPYPGQFGPIRFSTSAFIGFSVATMTSILDSIGDYYACAATCRVPPPPPHGVNRGIAVEGLCTALSGVIGCGHATTTYGANIGAIGLTKVASRQVFVCAALVYIIFGVVGKISAVFIIIPNPVLGGSLIIMFGIFIGVILSNLRVVDLTSTRNITIIGTAILLGLMFPQWIKENPDAITTGNEDADYVIRMMLANPSLISGIVSCFLDNTIPGTLEERGILAWRDVEHNKRDMVYIEGIEVYEPTYVPRRFLKLPIMKYIPFLPYHDE